MNELIKIGSQFIGAGYTTKKEIIDYYNENCVSLVDPKRRYFMKMGDEWCAAFTSVVAHKAGYAKSEFPYEVSVFYQCEIAKAWGTYSEKMDFAKVGDLLIYDWNKGNRYNHVGFISEVGESYYYVLEGNYSNTVKIRKVNKGSGVIRGVIHIDPKTDASAEYKRITSLANKVIRGEFGDGAERVTALGDDYHAVQRRVNELLML